MVFSLSELAKNTEGDKMELSDRKKKILQAIIDDYIASAEPIGSSHILKHHDLGVSSATIRNEMASLEEAGYLEKPHTSAGRVPSYLGYRVYVDQLMHKYMLSMNEINQITTALHTKYVELRRTIDTISDIMSVLTDYTAIYTTPVSTGIVIRNIKLIPVDSYSFVALIVSDGGVVKNRTIRTSKPFEPEVLDKLSNYLNYRFNGCDTSEFVPEVLSNEKLLIPVDDSLIDSVFEFFTDVANEAENVDVIMNGTTNIFKHPEFNDIGRTREFLNFIKKDNSKIIKSLLSETGDSTSVIIGNENPVLKDKDISLVVSNYSLGGSMKGKLAIIGPTRMDYAKVISTLDYLTGCINNVLGDDKTGDDKS